MINNKQVTKVASINTIQTRGQRRTGQTEKDASWQKWVRARALTSRKDAGEPEGGTEGGFPPAKEQRGSHLQCVWRGGNRTTWLWSHREAWEPRLQRKAGAGRGGPQTVGSELGWRVREQGARESC